MTMNHTTYIFGNLGNGYCQYPDDYTSELFKSFYCRATAPAQLIAHRDGNLMYYGYVRKIGSDGGCYIGLCVLLNGIYLKSVLPLLDSFERVISEMAAEGRLLRMHDNGVVVTASPGLLSDRQELGRVAGMVGAALDGMKGHADMLPPVSYNVSKDTVKYYEAGQADDTAIVDDSCRGGYVVVSRVPPVFPASVSESSGQVTDKQSAGQYDKLKAEYRRKHGITVAKPAPNPSPVSGNYGSLYEELKAKCNPDKFMRNYDHDKVKVAIDLYQRVIAARDKYKEQIKLRRMATEKLGVKFSTRQLYDELCSMCNPINFTSTGDFDSQKAAVANDLYADVLAYADDIDILEAIKEQAVKAGLDVSMRQGEAADDSSANELTFMLAALGIIICIAIIMLLCAVYGI